jgi:hypothetical protein
VILMAAIGKVVYVMLKAKKMKKIEEDVENK